MVVTCCLVFDNCCVVWVLVVLCGLFVCLLAEAGCLASVWLGFS